MHQKPTDTPVSFQILLEQLHHGLIVSCQAELGEPFHGARYMAVMAKAAQAGGAAGIRANGVGDIIAIRSAVNLPVIGIYKEDLPGFDVRITPSLKRAREIAAAGAEIIALDATQRPHPDGLDLAERIRTVHREIGRPVMADISTLEEGLAAEIAGADLIATTLSGYTEYSPARDGPDLILVERLAKKLKIPLVAEGRIVTPEQAREALRLGAFAVVVGGAITRPQWIVEQFVRKMGQP